MLKVAVVSSSFPPLSAGGVSSAQYGFLRLIKKQKNIQVYGFSFLDNYKLEGVENENIIRSGTPLILKKIISFLQLKATKLMEISLSQMQYKKVLKLL